MFKSSKRCLKRLLCNSIFLVIVLTGLIILLSFFSSNHVFANGGPALIPGLGAATIDGVIDSTEWSTASTYNQLMTDREPNLNGTIYLMQDNTSLYIGFSVDDDELSNINWYGLLGDTIFFEFDDNNSGSLWEIGENKVQLYSFTPWWNDSHFTTTEGHSAYDSQKDGIGHSSRQGNLNHFELSYPLCSGDLEDFCLSTGDIVGFRLKYYDVPMDDNDPKVYFIPSSSTTSLATITIMDWENIFLPLVSK